MIPTIGERSACVDRQRLLKTSSLESVGRPVLSYFKILFGRSGPHELVNIAKLLRNNVETFKLRRG